MVLIIVYFKTLIIFYYCGINNCVHGVVFLQSRFVSLLANFIIIFLQSARAERFHARLRPHLPPILKIPTIRSLHPLLCCPAPKHPPNIRPTSKHPPAPPSPPWTQMFTLPLVSLLLFLYCFYNSLL